MNARRRRWSFSLRTLFVVVGVVAIPLGWVAYQLNWIRQRHEYLQENHVYSDNYILRRLGRAPGSLGFFGEEGFRFMSYRSELGSVEMKRVQSLFPEVFLFDRAALD